MPNTQQTNPWSSAPSEEVTANPWGSEPSDTDGQYPTETSGDWLADAGPETAETGFDLLDPFQEAMIPLGDWVDQGLEWLVDNFRGVFQAIRWPIDATLTGIEASLQAVPDLLMLQ